MRANTWSGSSYNASTVTARCKEAAVGGAVMRQKFAVFDNTSQQAASGEKLTATPTQHPASGASIVMKSGTLAHPGRAVPVQASSGFAADWNRRGWVL
jgi:hypothetical protein